MKNFCLSLSVVLGLCFQSWAQDTIPLTFEEAVQFGIQQNITFKKLQNQQEVLRMERLNAQLSHLPNLNLSNDTYRQIGQQFQQAEGELIVTNEVNDIISGRVNSNMTVFNSFRVTNTRKAAKKFEEAGEFSLERAIQDLIFDIGSQYLQVLLDEQLYKIANENLLNQRKQLEQIEGYVEVGLRTLADFYNQKSEVARLETVALEAKIQWERDLWILAETIQLPSNTIPAVAPIMLEVRESELLKNPLDVLLQMAEDQRNDYRQVRSLELGNRSLLAAAKASYLPRLDAFFNYSTFYTTLDQRTFSNQFFTIFPQRAFGLSLSIPIFNNFSNKADVARSRMEWQNQQLDKMALQKKISQEVKLASENYKAAIQRKESTQVQLDAAEEAQNAISERFRLGISNFVDLAQANQQLVTAQSDFAQARFTLYFQEVMFKYALGILEL
ncbi:TolC family protein [Belliella marina]|uniref:TolC family protein n=1 Tax=Belliella marina TaxID=1644146 RepID=A0ABW4VL13_9BACT